MGLRMRSKVEVGLVVLHLGAVVIVSCVDNKLFLLIYSRQAAMSKATAALRR